MVEGGRGGFACDQVYASFSQFFELLDPKHYSPAFLGKIRSPIREVHVYDTVTISVDKYRPEARTQKGETQTHHTLV
jgi:hypothetical protein